MTLDDFLVKLKTQKENIEFEETMQVIEESYNFQPTAFTNATHRNEKGTNEGSCKIFAFAQINNLDSEQTLNCFGKYYRQDVLQHPENQDHANIRQFMKTGLGAIQFEQMALTKKP